MVESFLTVSTNLSNCDCVFSYSTLYFNGCPHVLQFNILDICRFEYATFLIPEKQGNHATHEVSHDDVAAEQSREHH